MKCRHLKIENKIIRTFGNEILTNSTRCLLKEQGKEKQEEIYRTLFKAGIEGSFSGYNCPFIDRGKLVDECPFINK